MRNALAIYTREVKSYFTSPIFYILALVFMLMLGNTFKDSFFAFATETMRLMRMVQNYRINVPVISIDMVVRQLFAYINFLFILVAPLVTMRLYAEERKNGTMELLMTSPVTTAQVMMGKFFSALTVYVILLALTLAFNVIMMVESHGKLDWGLVLSAYLGAILLGGAVISIGMFFSALTENQIVAAATTLTTVMVLWLLIQTARFLAPPFSGFVKALSLSTHVEAFSAGFIQVEHIVYFLSVTVFGLFLTGITIESARWRQ